MRFVPYPWNPSQIKDESYDVFVATTGFEQRARHIAELMNPDADINWAPSFGNRQLLEFEANKTFFSRRDFKTDEINEGDFQKLLVQLLQSATKHKEEKDSIHILVDISSMSRQRMAGVIDALRKEYPVKSIVTDFVYSIAEFSDPPEEINPITESGPVSPDFAGWNVDSTISTSAMFGLGFEQDQVLGVVEYLETDDIWVFIPEGPDHRYLESVESANETLWEIVPEERRLRYSVTDVYDTFLEMESLVYGLLATKRPIIIPFGPKIFSIISMIVSAMHDPDVPVWRVSTGQTDTPANRQGSDILAGIRLETTPNNRSIPSIQ